MDALPPLPEPGPQSPDNRRVIGRRFIFQAAQYLLQGDRLQAGEKAWGAVAHNLKVIGEQRGWNYDSHRQVESIGRQIVAEFRDAELGFAISDVYHNGHGNLYENQQSRSEIREIIKLAEETLPLLEAIQRSEPRPFTIESDNELRRLRVLTGNNELQIGDTSPVGFSLKHTPDGDGQDAAATD